MDRRIEAANRLTGEARRKAWADLDIDLMRDNPPWAPLANTQNRTFVSPSSGLRPPPPRSTGSTSPPSARSRWPAGSHFRSRCSPPGAGCSWHRASRARPVAPAQPGRRGRAARCDKFPRGRRLRRPGARVRGLFVADRVRRRARSCSTTRTRRARPGRRLVPEVVDHTRSRRTGGPTPSTLKKTFRFHTGAPGSTAQSFADAFNRDANPSSRRRRPLHARDRRRRVGIDGKAAIDHRRPRARPLPAPIRLTRSIGDFTARLTMPFFCPILPGTRPISPIDQRPARSGAVLRRKSESSTSGSC